MRADEQQVEREIRTCLANADQAALDMIWERYASDLLAYLTSLHFSRHDAEDSLQDVFVTIARKRETVAKARRLKPYLFRIARNISLNRMKRTKRRREQTLAMPDWLASPPPPDAQAVSTRPLESALAKLPEKQRSVLVLKHFREKTFREISELLGVSQNTVASRYRYGLCKLRDAIGREEQ